MKRGTASRVVIGGNTMLDLPKGLVFGTDVILGGIAGLTSDFNGLVLSNTLMLGKKISHISVITVIVRGQSPLNLPYAIADSLHYVKAFGGTEQRNLPAEYTQVNYVTNTAQTMINTGVKFDFSKNYEIELKASGVTGSWYILQARESSGSPISGISGSSTGNVIGVNFDGTYVAASQISRVFGHIYYVKGTINNGNMTLYVKDETAGTEETVTGTYTPRTGQSVDICLFGNTGGNYVAINSDVYFARIKENDTVVMDYVPARQSATAGFYDKVSGTFKTASNLVADGNAVPTPDTPMDIVSNNGVLKARHASGLPLGYTLLDYIESSGTQYIDLGIKGNGTTKVDVKFKYHTATSASGSGRVFGSRNAAAVDAFAIGSASGSASTNSTIAFFFGNQSYLVTDKSLVLDEWLSVIFDKTTHSINGTDYGDPYNDETFETPQNLKLFGFDNNGSVGVGYVDIAYCKLWNNGVLVRDLIPAKNNSNIIGMYDLVSGQFFTNAGTGDFVAGTAVSDPVEIYTDGTVETLWMHSKNLFDEIYPDVSNIIQYLPIYVGDGKFTCSYSMPNIGGNGSIVFFLAGNVSSGANNNTNGVDNIRPRTVTSVNGYVTIGYRNGTALGMADIIPTDYNCQIEKGSTATTYEPYYNGGSATCEDLLSVGDYTDVQEVIAGDVTRKVGIKVLDGTESWTVASTNVLQADVFPVSSVQPAVGGYCTALSYTDSSTLSGMPENSFRLGSQVYPRRLYVKSSVYATDATTWTNYLKAQYAAGTSVIVVYPLATPTTESVTGQTMNVQEGNNTLEITQASMDGLELEASYDTGVVAIIQEVQDVNLNNNVTVTIE